MDIARVRQYLEQGRGGPALDELMTLLSRAKSECSTSEWAAFCEGIEGHELLEVFLQCPATQRAHRKPRGYAGDAELMDLLYRFDEPAAEGGLLGAQIYARLVERAEPSLHGRIALMGARLDALPDGASGLSIACGHAREIEDRHRRLKMTAFDQDEASLRVLSARLPWVTTVAGNIRSLIAGEAIRGRYDAIYASGLYDYLSAEAGSRLTEVLAGALTPGGALTVGNFTHAGDEVAYMESFMAWKLVRRTPEELLALAPSGFESSVELGPQGYVAYLTVRRS
jgi:hypothetical protein